MRIDWERRTIEVGFRELVADFDTRRAGRGGSRLRVALGRRAHARMQASEAQRWGEQYGAEVPVELALSVDGFEVTVRGRIDARLRRDDGTVEVHEYKSVLRPGRLDRASAARQVCAYALALHRGAEAIAVRAVVVQIPLEPTGFAPTADEVEFDPDRTEALLLERVRHELERARRRRALAESRRLWTDDLAFPFSTMRPGQVTLLDAFAEAFETSRPLLASAPTGSGKTAVALLGGLRFAGQRGARVFYATAKTTQHEHIGRTFVQLCERNPLPEGAPPGRAVSLHARARVCRGCQPFDCERRARHGDRIDAARARAEREPSAYLDEARLRVIADETEVCPHALAHDLAEEADVVIGDTHHWYDPHHAGLTNGERPTVVIVDEAHNLPDRVRVASSFVVSRADVDAAIPLVSQDDPLSMDVQSWLGDLDAVFDTLSADDGSFERLEYEDRFELPERPPALRELGLRAQLLLLRWLGRGDGTSLEDPVAELLSLAASRWAGPAGEDVRVPCARLQPRTLAEICVDAAPSLAERHAKALGVAALSGTLVPLEAWVDRLGFRDLRPVVVGVPSDLDRGQRLVLVVPSISLRARDRGRSLGAVVQTVAQVMRARPGPYLLFTSSFAMATSVSDALRPTGLAVHLQPRSSDLRQRKAVLDRFVTAEGPRLLVGVAGGVFAEGIDLPRGAALGVIVLGPCLPPPSFERAAIARHFQQTLEAGFAHAMLIPGLQRVIQAAGRVVRGPEDRGVVILIGGRFAEPGVFDLLPDDFVRGDPSELVTEDLPGTLRAFWEG